MNQAGFTIDFYWIHPTTKELAASNTDGDGVMYGSESSISSYVGHEFEVQELPNNKTKLCRGKDKVCKKGYFMVNNNEDQWVTLGPELINITISDSKSRAMDKAKTSLEKCNVTTAESALLTPTEQIQQISECLQRQIEITINQTDDEIQFQATVRKDIGQKLKKYVCTTTSTTGGTVQNLTTTKSVRNSTWDYIDPFSPRREKKTLDMNYLFESDYSSIRLLKNFISKDECNDFIRASGASVTMNNGAQSGVFDIAHEARQKHTAIDAVLTKIDLLLNTVLHVDGGGDVDDDGETLLYYDAKDDPLVEVYIRTTSTSTSANTGSDTTTAKDCEIDVATGTCSATTTTVSDDSTTAADDFNGIRLSESTEHTAANIMLFCGTTTPGASQLVASATNMNSGMVYFPKAGVRVVPAARSTNSSDHDSVIGDLLLVVHMDPLTNKREEDPFVDEYIMCPVLDPPTTSSDDGVLSTSTTMMVTIEDTVTIG
jgi:hypothetical protein